MLTPAGGGTPRGRQMNEERDGERGAVRIILLQLQSVS